MKDPLKELSEDAWKLILFKLVKYATFKVRRLHWRTVHGELPTGKQPEDLAMEAIQKTLEGFATQDVGKGIRRWNPDKEPDFFEHLKGVVDSDVSALVNLEEHKRTNYSADIEADEATTILVNSIDEQADPIESPQLDNVEQEIVKRESSLEKKLGVGWLIDRLRFQFKDDPEVTKIIVSYQDLSELDEELKPSIVAEYAGLDMKVFNAAKRRLERKVEEMRKELLKKGGGSHV